MIQIINDMIGNLNSLSFNEEDKYGSGVALRTLISRIRSFCIGANLPSAQSKDRELNSLDSETYGRLAESESGWNSIKTKILGVLYSIRDEAQIIQAKEDAQKRERELAAQKLQMAQMAQNTRQNSGEENIPPSPTKKSKRVDNNRIFIVHGHEEKMKLATARAIEKLGLEAVILHEQPNSGRTIIEKIDEFSEVGFAIVLLSPDDLGYEKDSTPEKARFRARQNVILELGYFLGKLGRGRVIALYMPQSNFEMPSDYDGVLYIPFDNAGRWQFDLVKELKACDYKVDANKLV